MHTGLDEDATSLSCFPLTKNNTSYLRHLWPRARCGYCAFAPSAPAALNSPNETDRKTRARNTGPAQSLSGEPDGTASCRVCNCRFVVDACLVRGRCVGMPRGRARLQRICPRLRHCRRQAFRVAAMRAPQPAAGLHTCVVPSRWFAHHLGRTRNGHVPTLAPAGRASGGEKLAEWEIKGPAGAGLRTQQQNMS